MNETAAPWRVLEEPADAEGQLSDGSATSSSPSAARSPGIAGPGIAGSPVRLALVVAAVALAAVVGVGAVVLAALPTGGSVSVDTGPAEPTGSAAVAAGDIADIAGSKSSIVVDVAGAVVHPGVYHLPANARIGDAIAAAGGYGPRLDATRASIELNLAARLSDGDRVRVPSRDDRAAAGGSAAAGSSASAAGTGSSSTGAKSDATAPGKVDINSATSSELEALPGIGPVTAAKIIAAREERPFASLEELTSRKVIGASLFAKVRAYLTVR